MQSGVKGSFTLKRMVPEAGASGAPAAAGKTTDDPKASSIGKAADITLETPTGKIHGTLQLPEAPAKCPVVLMHAGSGPTDRDGNTPLLPGKNDSLKMIAQGLAEEGIACLLYTSRCV